MLSARWLLSLALFASSVSFAQSSEEPPSASSQAEAPPLSPPPLVRAPEQPEEEPPQGESLPYQYRPATETSEALGGRLFLEALGGAGTGAVAGLAGLITGGMVVGFECASADCVLPVLGSMTVAIVLGTPLGVYGVGRALGARGSYLAALIGTVLGSALGIVGAAGAAALDSQFFTMASLMTGPLAGALLGFEFSHSTALPAPPPAPGAASAVQLVPVVGVTPRGSVLAGLAGRF